MRRGFLRRPRFLLATKGNLAACRESPVAGILDGCTRLDATQEVGNASQVRSGYSLGRQHEVLVARGVAVVGDTSTWTKRKRGFKADRASENDRLPHYQPANAGDRVKWFAISTAGPLSLLAAGPISAGFGTAINRPKEYGPHWDGFGKRYGMRLTGVSTGQRDRSVAGFTVGRGSAIFSVAAAWVWHTREVCDQDHVRGAAPRWDAASRLCAVHRKCRQQLSFEYLASSQRERGGERCVAMLARGGGADVWECVRGVLAGCAEESVEEVGEASRGATGVSPAPSSIRQGGRDRIQSAMLVWRNYD